MKRPLAQPWPLRQQSISVCTMSDCMFVSLHETRQHNPSSLWAEHLWQTCSIQGPVREGSEAQVGENPRRTLGCERAAGDEAADGGAAANGGAGSQVQEMLVLDCEMCSCGEVLEVTRITLLDADGKVGFWRGFKA